MVLCAEVQKEFSYALSSLSNPNPKQIFVFSGNNGNNGQGTPCRMGSENIPNLTPQCTKVLNIV